jgi:two-component system KDP operon response regulator KdpE
MSRALVVDDEAGLRKVVRDALAREGIEVVTAVDGEDALARFDAEGPFDLIVTDLGMPKVDGLGLVVRLRERSAVPILVLTVTQEERRKVTLLDAGADDYVTKPFGVAELLARVRALLRRSGPAPASPTVHRFGTIVADLASRRITRSGEEIHLTPTEYALLEAFLSKPGMVWTHRQLIARVWGTGAGVSQDALRVQASSLRRKLEENPDRPRFIRTEPWVGYRFVMEESPPRSFDFP